MPTFDISTGRFSKLDKGLWLCRLKAGRLELGDAVAGIEFLIQHKATSKVLVLVDARELNSISKEARRYYSTDSTVEELHAALAFLVSSAVSRMVVRFFVKLTSMPVPIEIFTDEDHAIEWLRGHLPSVNEKTI